MQYYNEDSIINRILSLNLRSKCKAWYNQKNTAEKKFVAHFKDQFSYSEFPEGF